MCGVAGFITEQPVNMREAILRMADRLAHRGPDDGGCWFDAEAGIALGHRRLSIVDLSPNGHQPMVSACGRHVIVLNGEIYNHAHIRKQLADEFTGIEWRGHSDTEVLLAGISRWGLQRTLQACVGMFAFAVWDRQARTLSLARDRFGEKPLYYGKLGTTFVFGSELKALGAYPGVQLDVDRQALVSMMQFGYVPGPRSIWRGIAKLPPGNCLTVRTGSRGRFEVDEVKPYWNIGSARNAAGPEFAHADDAERVQRLDGLLQQSVRDQMVADVPLGAFLSGGVDSSLVVALMQSHSARPVRTFTIGFREEGYDEAPFARAVADYLGTQHTEWYITPREAAGVIPELPHVYDEPFADASQVPTALVARMTRQHVTVALSGDGGDELFGGYPRYDFAQTLWRRLGGLPAWARQAMSAGATALTPRALDRMLRWVVPARRRESVNGHRVHRLASLTGARSFEDMYARLLSQWAPEGGLVLGGGGEPSSLGDVGDDLSLLDRMRCWDIDRYLPDDILVKVDRAAMSVGLETRAPLLDHRVAEFAWALPEHALLRHGRGKQLLRQVLDRYVPPKLIERPKTGFGMPVARWLRVELRDWAESLLSERAIREQGFLAPAMVRRMWQEHLAGTHDHQSRLWTVLMFQAWLETQRCVVARVPNHPVAANA